MLFLELWVWGISAHYLGGIFETFPECELCGGRGEVPAAREESNSGWGEAPRVESCSDSAFSLHQVVLL